jgi:hypothetical protein
MEEMPQDCREQSRPPHPCGLATQGAVAEGPGEIFLNKSPSIPLFQRGKKFPGSSLFKGGRDFRDSLFQKEVICSDIRGNNRFPAFACDNGEEKRQSRPADKE